MGPSLPHPRSSPLSPSRSCEGSCIRSASASPWCWGRFSSSGSGGAERARRRLGVRRLGGRVLRAECALPPRELEASRPALDAPCRSRRHLSPDRRDLHARLPARARRSLALCRPGGRLAGRGSGDHPQVRVGRCAEVARCRHRDCARLGRCRAHAATRDACASGCDRPPRGGGSRGTVGAVIYARGRPDPRPPSSATTSSSTRSRSSASRASTSRSRSS